MIDSHCHLDHELLYSDLNNVIKRSKETLNFKQKLFHLSQRAVASKGYLEAVTWSFTDSRVDKQFSQGKKEIEITNPISSDLNVLRRSIFSNLII